MTVLVTCHVNATGGNTTIPELIAHRGWPARYPENSLEGLSAAVDAGARFLEFDVQLAGDGVPLLLHDDNLARTAGVDLSVLATRASIVRSVARDSAPVATLAEACEWLAGQPVTAFVEIKRQSLAHFGAARAMRRLGPALRPARDRCVVISFAAEALEFARASLEMPIGWVLDGLDESRRARAEHLAPEYFFVSRRRVKPGRLWPGPWRWAVYTVDDPAAALSVGRAGAHFVETDDIGAMLADPAFRPGTRP